MHVIPSRDPLDWDLATIPSAPKPPHEPAPPPPPPPNPNDRYGGRSRRAGRTPGISRHRYPDIPVGRCERERFDDIDGHPRRYRVDRASPAAIALIILAGRARGH